MAKNKEEETLGDIFRFTYKKIQEESGKSPDPEKFAGDILFILANKAVFKNRGISVDEIIKDWREGAEDLYKKFEEIVEMPVESIRKHAPGNSSK